MLRIFTIVPDRRLVRRITMIQEMIYVIREKGNSSVESGFEGEEKLVNGLNS